MSLPEERTTHFRMQPILVVGCIVLLFWPSCSFAGTFTAFGPTTYQRQRGRPVPVTSTFSVLNPDTQYTLRLESRRIDEDGDKDSDEGDPQARARVLINGREIISFEDFENDDERQHPAGLV